MSFPVLTISSLGRTEAIMRSAGKRLSGKTRYGNQVRAALVQAAHALTHTKTYLAAQFWRLTRRRGKKRQWQSFHSGDCLPSAPTPRALSRLGEPITSNSNQRQLANAWLSAWKNWATRSCSSPSIYSGSLTVGLFSSQ